MAFFNDNLKRDLLKSLVRSTGFGAGFYAALIVSLVGMAALGWIR